MGFPGVWLELMPLTFRLCVLKLFLLLGPVVVWAGNAWPVEGEKDEIVFSLAEVSPWAGYDEDGNPQGVLVTLVDAMKAETGLPLISWLRPYTRVLRELEEGEVDYAFAFDSPRIREFAKPVAHVMSQRTLVVGRAEMRGIDSLSELVGMKVGYIRGTWYGEEFERQEGLERIPVWGFAHGAALLKYGRIQAMVVGEAALTADLKEKGAPVLRGLLELEGAQGKLFVSRKSEHKHKADELAEALEMLLREGALNSLNKGG